MKKENKRKRCENQKERCGKLGIFFISIGILVYIICGYNSPITRDTCDNPLISMENIVSELNILTKKLKLENVKEDIKENIETSSKETSTTISNTTQEILVVPTITITDRLASDPYPNDKETVATISIPDIDLYEAVTYGDSQSNLDEFQVTMRNGHSFNQNGAVILAGHNYKVFGSLMYVNTGSRINIHAYYGDFTFFVSDVVKGTTDGWNIYDESGNEVIDMYNRENCLYLYTCDDSQPNGRLVVIAHQL